jgi:hypothetical protein
LKKAQARQKTLYDRNRRPAEKFKVGDLVLKKKNATMVSFATAKWTGHRRIIEVTNQEETAYRLKRYSEGALRLTTANITQLKEFHGYKGRIL